MLPQITIDLPRTYLVVTQGVQGFAAWVRVLLCEPVIDVQLSLIWGGARSEEARRLLRDDKATLCHLALGHPLLGSQKAPATLRALDASSDCCTGADRRAEPP